MGHVFACLGLVVALSSLLPGQATAQQTARSVAPASLHAPQEPTLEGSFGVLGGVFVHGEGQSGPLLGVEGWFPIKSGLFAFNPGLDFAMANDWFLILSADLCFVVAPRSPVRLWVGGGGSLIDRKAWFSGQDQTDFAGNLLAGVDMGDDDLRFYVRVKAMFSNTTHMSFVTGLRF